MPEAIGDAWEIIGGSNHCCQYIRHWVHLANIIRSYRSQVIAFKEPPMPADTAKVVGRRQLDYTSFEELLADAERMSSGSVNALGNWSAGQIFKHLAIMYNGSIDGLPVTFSWPFRMVVKLFKTRIINGPMPPGYKMKPENAAFTEPGPISTEQGLADLCAAVARLQRESYRAKHPLFGNLTKEEW
ncbi:MAG TPA: DUF1569 domain-containing protein, partial [Gemmata sp.]|nr:DUF1569 domain-containing protein [Gemmata sp.]